MQVTLSRTLSYGGAIAVHARIAAAEHDDIFSLHVDEISAAVQPQLAVDIGNEIRQCFVNARKIFAVEAALDVRVGPHAEKHRVELGRDLFECDIASHLDIQPKFNTHAFHNLAPLLDDVLFQLERWNAEGQQSADLGIPVENDRLDAVAHQDVGTGETRGSRTDDRYALVCAHHIRHVRLPAEAKGFVRNVFFDGADAHGAESVVQGACAFTQPVLRTNPAAHFRQRIGLMRQLGGFEQLAVVDQRQPELECSYVPGISIRRRDCRKTYQSTLYLFPDATFSQGRYPRFRGQRVTLTL